MANSKSKVDKNKHEKRNCSEPGRINMHVKIDGDKREKEWDFLHGGWKERKTTKSGWDLRYN